MKKIFYTGALSMFLTINVFANDNVIDLTEAGLSKIDLSQVEMPTESEIKQIIDKYNFSSEQKEQIYKDTKRQLDMLYAEMEKFQKEESLKLQKRK